MDYCVKLARYREKGSAGKDKEKPLNATVFFFLCEVMLIYEPAGRSIQRVDKSKTQDRAERTLLARQQQLNPR